MKKVSLLVFVVFTLLFYTTTIIGADNNLIQNSSFENGSGQTPEFWQVQAWDKTETTTEFKHESGNAHSGSKFATIINNVVNDSRYMQPVNVSENKMYMLSCWVKAANIPKDKKGANISMEGKLESSADVWDTGGNWQQIAMYAKTGPGITTFTVTVGIGTYGSINTGRASFDDVSVVEVSSIPDGAVVCNLVNNTEQQQSGTEDNNNNNSGNSNSPTSIFGWILFIGIFVVIIVFVLYRSLTKKAPQATDPPDSEDTTDESQPADTATEEQTDDRSKAKGTKPSDDLL